MHFNFVKGPKGDKVRFFQSSFPYLNNSAVSAYKAGRTKKWTTEEPHPSSQRILTFSNGHYGIYFTIFNHELKREERTNFQESSNTLIVMAVPTDLLLLFLPEFFISKANQEIHNDISELKLVSRDWLSTFALLNPRRAVRQVCVIRRFCTWARILDDSKPNQEHQHAYVANEAHTESLRKIEPLLKIEELSEDSNMDIHKEPIEEPFERSFQRSQVNRIVSAFASHSSPADLNIIYPIYQSLKRNDIALPTIHEYNIVLKSIAMRSLDSEATLEAIESRLTSLLTVYQDVLQVCSKNAKCKPDNETFNIVLNEIFKGAVSTINLGSSTKISNDIYQEALFKSEEFCQVGINLFMSVKDQNELDLKTILPNLITAVNVHPNLLLKKVATRLIDIHEIQCSEGPYYVGLINMSRYLKDLNVMATKEDVYKFVSSVFELYKSQTANHAYLLNHEYQIYSPLVQSLIRNGNMALAAKFLDDILVDYKNSLISAADKSLLQQKANISNLLSDYLQAIMNSGESADLNRAYNLLEKFREVNYIPDFNVQVYNEMINKFINEYTVCEIERTQGREDVADRQRVLYNKIWKLYDRVAIRRDFQTGPIVNPKSQDFGLKVNCRDFLLSLSLDLSDHTQITRLLKEILLKNHVISDWNVSKKLCIYLYNGVAAYRNTYYADLLWSVLEQQASRYLGNSEVLNNFLSEHVSFTMIENPENFNRVLDSHMIYLAFRKFNLKKDNIYGVMTLATHLMFNYPIDPTSSQTFKLMLLQSCLINEFEDSDNHYLQLSPEVEQFKQTLYQLFASLHSVYTGMRLTEDISAACKKLGLDLQVPARNFANLSHKDFRRDLSALFSVNNSVAVTEFLESFRHGYNFYELTWKAVINQNFAFDVLERDTVIRIKDFVSRLLNLNLGAEAEQRLISSLIDLNNEKINIEVLKYMIENKVDLLYLNQVLISLMDFGTISENRYFMNIVADNLENFVTRNDNRVWLSKCLSWFVSAGQAQKMYSVLEPKKEDLVYGLDVKNPADENFLKGVLFALLNLGKSEEVNQIFRHYFDGKKGNIVLLQSDQLLECLLNHYIATGAYEDVVSKFGSFQSRSSSIKQLIQFAQFMSELNGHKSKSIIRDYGDANTVGLAILNENNLLQMKEIYEENRLLVRDREQFFDFLISCLTKASSLSGNRHAVKINQRFESIVKFCKVLRINEISVSSLINIIKLLSLINGKNLLNILVNKLVNGLTLSPFVNLYFLQVNVLNTRDATQLLKALKNALIEVGDDVNIHMIADLEAHMS